MTVDLTDFHEQPLRRGPLALKSRLDFSAVEH